MRPEAYAFQAELYCPLCASHLVRGLQRPAEDDPRLYDSDTWPQPIFFGESDFSQHCAACGSYLYGGQEPEADAGPGGTWGLALRAAGAGR